MIAEEVKRSHSRQPATILTANTDCQAHLQTATRLPVRHWIEALDQHFIQG